MASKKTLDLRLAATVEIDPQRVSVNAKGVNQKIEAAFRNASKGLVVKDTGSVKVDPKVASLTEADFKNFTKKYTAETDKLIKRADEIDRVRAERATDGQPINLQSKKLAEVARASANVRAATLEVFKADRAIDDSLNKKIASGGKLAKNEQALLNQRYEAYKNFTDASRQLAAQQKGKTFFDIDNQQKTQPARYVKGLTQSVKAAEKQTASYGKQLAEVTREQNALTQATKNASAADKQILSTDKAIAANRTKSLGSLKEYRKQLDEISRVVPTDAKFAGQQGRKAFGTADQIKKDQKALASFQKQYEKQFTPREAREVAAIQGQLGKLQEKAVSRGDRLVQQGENIARQVRERKDITRELQAVETRAKKEAASYDKQILATDKAIAKNRTKSLNSLKDYRKQLEGITKLTPTDAKYAGQLGGKAFGTAKQIEKDQKALEAFQKQYAKQFTPKEAREVATIQAQLGKLQEKAVQRGDKLVQQGENLARFARAEKEKAINARKTEMADSRALKAREAQIRVERSIANLTRSSNRHLDDQYKTLKNISGVQATSAGHARQLERSASAIARSAAKQKESIASFKTKQGYDTLVGPPAPAVEQLNKAMSRLDRVTKKATNTALRFSDQQKNLAESSSLLSQRLSQGSLLIRQFFRYAIGYGALYQALGAVNALKNSVLELDKALFSIKAIADATAAEMVKISGAIKRVAIDTKFTTAEVAKAAQVLSQAGVSANELPKALEAVSKFAAGTETQIKTAADLVSTMRNVFKELDDLSIANQLTKAINISKLTGEDLRTILGISAQVAKQYNLTSQNYLAAVTTLRNAGLKASTTATGLRQGLNELFSPDTKTVKALVQRYKDIGEQLTGKEVREKFFGFTTELNPLLAAARELARLGFTGAGKKTLSRGFDIRAANALTALVNNIDELESAQTQLASGDQVFRASATQLESLSNSVDNLGAAMTVLAANISEGPVRSLEDLVDGATEAIQRLSDLDTSAKALGEAGAGQIAGTTIAGGLIGATLGRTPLQKFGGGLAGAGLGAYAGSEQLENRAEGRGNLINPEALNITLGIISLFSLLGGNSLLKRFFGTGNHASTIMEGVKKGVKAVELGMLKFLRGLNYIRPVFGILGAKILAVGLAVGGIVTLVDLMLSDSEDEAESLKRRRKALNAKRNQLEKKRQELDKNLALSAEYKPADPTEGQARNTKEGSVARNLERNIDLAANYEKAFDEVFGARAESDGKAIEAVLRTYRSIGIAKGTKNYFSALEKLREVSGLSEEQVELLEERITFLANTEAELRNKSKSILAELQKRLQEAKIAETEGSETNQAKALLLTFRSASEASASAIQAVQTGQIESAAEFTTSIQSFYADYAKNLDSVNSVGSSKLELETGQLAADLENIEQLLKTSPSAAEASVAIKELETSFLGLGPSAVGYIRKLLAGLLQFQNKLQADLLKQAIEVEELAKKSAKGSRSGILAGKYQNAKQVLEALQSDQSELAAIIASLVSKLNIQVQSIEEANVETAGRLNTALDAVAEVDPKEIAKLATTQPELAKEFAKLLQSPEARDQFAEAQTSKNKNNELLILKLGESLIKFINDLNQRQAKSVDDIDPLKRSPYIQDPATYRKIYELDLQIAEAKKRNLRLLTEENTTNPLIAKRDLLLDINRKEVAAAQAFLASQLKEYGGLGGNNKERAEVIKSQAEIQKKRVEGEKIAADAELARQDNARKLQDQILSVETDKLKLREDALKQELDTAKGTGSVANVAEISRKLAEVENDLLDIEISKLALEEQDTDLVQRTLIAKRDALDLLQLRNRIAAEAAALERKEQNALSALAGDAATQGLAAYAESSGRGDTVTEEAYKLLEELGVQLEFARERVKTLNENLQESDLRPEDRIRLNEELIAAQKEVGSFAGQMQVLNSELNGYVLTFANFQEVWESSTSDMAQNLRDSVAVWYQESPRTIETFLKSIGDGIGIGLSNIFRKFADNAIEKIVQRGMDESLSFLRDTLGIKEEVKQEYADVVNLNANTVNAGTGTQPSAAPFGTTAPLSGGITDPALGPATAYPLSSDDLTAGPLGLEGEDTEAANLEETSNNTDALVGSTLATQLLSGNVEGFVGTLISQGAFEQVRAAQQATQSIGLLTQLQANTIALGTNTTALYSSGGITSALGGATGGVIKYAEGGILRGKGTSTSDSMRGVLVGSSGKRQPIAVSNGEGILTAKAVDLLGEDFVFAINKASKLPAFAMGGVMGKSNSAINKLKDAVVSVSAPTVNAGTKVVNVLDGSLLTEVMKSDEGERVILNHIQNNIEGINALRRFK